MNSSDFNLARMKHWLRSVTATAGTTLSVRRNPSPDSGGSTLGQMAWYDYAGKTNTEFEGTNFSPLFVGRVLPDGITAYTRSDRNSLGAPIVVISTFSSGGAIALRTNTYVYATNEIDLLAATNAQNIQVQAMCLIPSTRF